MKESVQELFISTLELFKQKKVIDILNDDRSIKILGASSQMVHNLYDNKMNLYQKELVARALANLDELKIIMNHLKNGDVLQAIAESKNYEKSLDISIKCLEHLYKLEKQEVEDAL